MPARFPSPPLHTSLPPPSHPSQNKAKTKQKQIEAAYKSGANSITPSHGYFKRRQHTVIFNRSTTPTTAQQLNNKTGFARKVTRQPSMRNEEINPAKIAKKKKEKAKGDLETYKKYFRFLTSEDAQVRFSRALSLKKARTLFFWGSLFLRPSPTYSRRYELPLPLSRKLARAQQKKGRPLFFPRWPLLFFPLSPSRT